MIDRSPTPGPPWEGRRVVLGVTAGLAAYKAVMVARELTRCGCIVDVVLSRSARSFIGPLSFEGVTGRPVHTSFLAGSGPALHLELGRSADAVLVAPATADFLARAATGRCDDLLASVLLATRAPVLVAPAMNHRMYEHPQTLHNVARCREILGYEIVGPEVGELGFGEEAGIGRMSDPETLVDHVGRALRGPTPLAGRRVLVTAGPTQEPVDPVRYLGNRSSGRMGFALARSAWMRGAEVDLVAGPVALPDPPGVRTTRVATAREMLLAVEDRIEDADVVVFAAAVADFRPTHPSSQKLKRDDLAATPVVTLTENPDVAGETRSRRREGSVVVGFALETAALLEGARIKMEHKEFDIIVANDPGEAGAGFGTTTNRVTLLDREGRVEALPLQSKDSVATAILDRVEALLREAEPTPGTGEGRA